ncbi:MAG: hypothetical protein E5Y88_08130 [Mesorhizobium sp.]|nr:hypothetical protein EJ075_03280 [Mesorhizobium sp. M6A.T.Cr.TU.016.01.1.1]RWP53276.1 MAG: hypothetical protein EOR06_16520 [Mesorhizobium sp.]RWQ68919.1 MAG: hypothetical protein EOS85_31230 [Mesorhizobium sp.]TIL27174.1 MAG: hypothetical protein E5Y88_08130 [Mesorhizobium sp.]
MGRSAASTLRPLLQRWRLAKAAERAISLLAGEMSGRTEGGGKDRYRAEFCAAVFEIGLNLFSTQSLNPQRSDI